MTKFLIRNDDVAYDTTIESLKTFCDICDKYGFPILHAIVYMGEYKKANAKMNNKDIILSSTKVFKDNVDVVNYLKSRNDLIGVHGLWHTHEPTEQEIESAKGLLKNLGFNPTYFVPPFNEGNYGNEVVGLKVSKLSLKNGERLEDFLKKGTPTSDVMYLHHWRFDNNWYTFEQLDNCLRRLCQ
jgi:hypothetical protein